MEIGCEGRLAFFRHVASQVRCGLHGELGQHDGSPLFCGIRGAVAGKIVERFFSTEIAALLKIVIVERFQNLFCLVENSLNR